MKIVNVICSPGRTGFYFDDQRAIKRGAGHDGMFYVGSPVTEGFQAVRQAGESISVMIVLEDGQVAYVRQFSIPVQAAVIPFSWQKTLFRLLKNTSSPSLLVRKQTISAALQR